MKAFDITTEYKDYFTASTVPETIEVPAANYVTLEGNGSPGTNMFYDKKSALKNFVEEIQSAFSEEENAFSGNIIEIFYWFDEDKAGDVNIGNFYTSLPLELLHYKIAVRLPDFISANEIGKVAQNSQNPFAGEFGYFTYTAGKCVQVLHLGPFADELETLPLLEQFATSKGLRRSGMHHEIHLTHFEKGQSQEHFQTILRDPVSTIEP